MAKDTKTAEEEARQTALEEEQNAYTGEIFAQWQFFEHDKPQRGKWWYIIAAILIGGLFAFAYFDNNPLLAIITILVGVTYTISEVRGPDEQIATITEDGIVVGTAAYEYDEIRNFFIIYEPPRVKMLYINPKSFLRPRVGIPLGDQNPVAIRQYLLEFVAEDLEKKNEPASDFFGRILKL